MNYEETIEYLYNSAPLFQNIGGKAYKEGLDNTLALDEHFGHPHKKFKTIHIAGTNGKGSCSHTIAAVLQEAGYRVGLYTSPHLIDFRERIKVNGKMIPQQAVIDFVENERAFFEPLHPSFFELTTALAFKYFADEKVDVAVIEVGLGGRLDCTNIITPELSIITNISFDHIQFLGDTLAKIASEKAGIIKEGVPVVIGETTPETRPVFQRKAKEQNSAIFFAEGLKCKMEGLKSELEGLCQEKNTKTISVALEVLRERGFNISDKNVKDGFGKVCELTGLMGRWQKLSDSPRVYCDTGHNVGGFQYISRQLAGISCNTLRIVFGMVNDKDISHVLEMLPKNAKYYFTKANVSRALDEKELARLASTYNLEGETFCSVEQAYRQALSDSGNDDFIFVGGSTFIVADLLKFVY
ncbi:MAG: bifunctional folylpolyglutamate synthase/dihydrofolate synthase [Bacteroidaceae bacterium]|nr:bifunctional folylpolyglutamate synthase/dihydrofolate synthase [Bacteroidaceae bacterium]